MGMQLEPLKQSSFEQYGPWHFRDIRFTRSEPTPLAVTTLLRTVNIHTLSGCVRDRSRTDRIHRSVYASGNAEASKPMSDSCSALKLSQEKPRPFPTKSDRSVLPASSTSSPALTFVYASPPSQNILSFPIRTRPALKTETPKRRRPDTDVDGFNTARLSCKKQRLLRHLITSRLSQPFSFPASHILNREAVASGDKRFLKLAAMMAARRMHAAVVPGQTQVQAQPLQGQLSPASLMRRAAVINRFRLRMQAESAGQYDGVSELTAKSTLVQHSHGAGFFVGTRYPAPSTPSQSSNSPVPVVRVPYPTPPQESLTRMGVRARPSPPGSPSRLRPTEPTTRTGIPGLRLPSPRLRPIRSPELRTTRPALDINDIEELDDDSISFPSFDHESRYDDEPEEVYADFGVIFGGGDGEDTYDEDGSGDHLEDYMDDLDGIPWNVRC